MTISGIERNMLKAAIGRDIPEIMAKLDGTTYGEVPSDSYYYIGDPSTNGSWRLAISGNDLVLQRRESGSWTTKETTYTGPRTVKTSVDASGGGTAQETAIVTIPLGSIIHEVVLVVTETFDGDATQSIEVGLTGNTDKYIDPVDVGGTPTADDYHTMTGGTNNDQLTTEFCVAAQAIVATWTNTADATAGAFDVYVTYTPPRIS